MRYLEDAYRVRSSILWLWLADRILPDDSAPPIGAPSLAPFFALATTYCQVLASPLPRERICDTARSCGRRWSYSNAAVIYSSWTQRRFIQRRIAGMQRTPAQDSLPSCARLDSRGQPSLHGLCRARRDGCGYISMVLEAYEHKRPIWLCDPCHPRRAGA
jgi:hypothetical protein